MIHGTNPMNGLRSNHSSTPQLDRFTTPADAKAPKFLGGF
jgi:hypothetical protein